MKKSKTRVDTPDMLPEYDFSGGVRGKHHKAYKEGHAIKIVQAEKTPKNPSKRKKRLPVALDPDVQAFFPDSRSVNHALRSLISAVSFPGTKAQE